MKSLLSEIACVLGHGQVILSVDVDNRRSISAARRLTSQPGELCHEPWYPRIARRFVLRHTADAMTLSTGALRMLFAQPACAGTMRAPAAPLPVLVDPLDLDGKRALSL